MSESIATASPPTAPPGSNLRRNSLANYVGQLWTVLLLLISLRLFRQVLGPQAYGLVTFYLSLQAAIFVLEVGMSAAITRELARMAGNHARSAQSGRNLLRSLEVIYAFAAVLIGAVLWFASETIALHWINAPGMSPYKLQQSLQIMALAIACQWPCGLYTGALTGLQRMVQLNLINMVFATLRSAGVFLPLWLIKPEPIVFFGWQVLVSVMQVGVMHYVVWRAMPQGEAAIYSKTELSGIWRFTASLGITALCGFALTQSDRVILSNFLSLDQLGQYFFAATAGGLFYRLAQPLYGALYPRFAQLLAHNAEAELHRLYHLSNQFLAVVIAPVAAVLIVYADVVLWLWTNDYILALRIAPILQLLVAAGALAALLNLANAVQLAYGMTRLSLYQTLIGLPIVLPALWLMAQRAGGLGAAKVLLGVSLCYFFIGIPLMHRWLLKGQMWRWYWRDMAPAIIISGVMAWLARYLFDRGGDMVIASKLVLVLTLGLSYLACLGGSIAGYTALQERLSAWLKVLKIKALKNKAAS